MGGNCLLTGSGSCFWLHVSRLHIQAEGASVPNAVAKVVRDSKLLMAWLVAFRFILIKNENNRPVDTCFKPDTGPTPSTSTAAAGVEVLSSHGP